MAGFGNETIPAFPYSDSARVDGMGRWWTSGWEKKNGTFTLQSSAQPCHFRYVV